MFGRLTFSAIPLHDHIIMGAVTAILVITVLVLAAITWFRLWPMLWKNWFTSLDHKKIGIMYIILSFIMLLRGMSDAIMMRMQQAMAAGTSQGYLEPAHFNQIFSAHGTIMIIFVAMPFMIGLMNLVIPPQIGARDVAFPYLNSISLWLTVAGAVLVMVSLGIGEFSTAGWSGYSPLTETAFTPGPGVDYWLWSLQIAGIGSLLTSINFLATILMMRAPGMTLMRMPIFVWTSLCTSILMVLSFPVLTVALGLTTLDRYLGMHFFSNDLGGNMMLYANLFWIWGHPEVYIVILPAFGIYSEIIATFSGKPLFAYKSMVFATVVITVLSFSVWVHHFFTMGSSADINIFFGITTMIIAVPTGVKIFNWLFTMFRGSVRFTTPVLWTLAFISTFAIGGMTGVLLATPPSDFVMHNSVFLVAHFHNMLIPGALFGYFAGFIYWFPKATGFMLNEKWGKRSFAAWVIGFYVAFVPLYILGFMGMPRRMAHYGNVSWQPYLIVAACGAFVILMGVIFLAVQLIVSIKERATSSDRTGDPWDGRTLEWSTSSPPPVYNFAIVPKVNSLDAFMAEKESGLAWQQPKVYEDILMPRNSASGIINGALCFTFGFAMVWHIWWLGIICAGGIIISLLLRASRDDTEYTISAAEVEKIENLWFTQREKTRHANDSMPAGLLSQES